MTTRKVGRMVGLTVSPANVRLNPDQTQQYTTTATWRGGRPSPYPVAWSATGGSITPSGLYTAGSTAGTYKVCATSGAFMPCVDLSLITTPTTQTIAPGESWQDKVNANPAGTAFQILAGTHMHQAVVPKSGDSFIGDPGAVMDGGNTTPRAFWIGSSPYPSNVTISGLEVKNYAPPFQYAMISAAGDSLAAASAGWVLSNLNVHHSSQVGIRIGSTMTVTGCQVHDNTTFGMSGPGVNTVVENTTIWNNGVTTNAESGGTKFVLTQGFIFRNNTVRDNNGPGIWMDIANIGYLIENNVSDDNFSEGIVIEISYGGTIQNNTVRRNGMQSSRSSGFVWNAGIGIHASGGTGIEVTGNTLLGNAQGITLLEQPRGSSFLNEPSAVDPIMTVKNINIHGNTVTLQAVTGSLIGSSLHAIVGADENTGAMFNKTTRNIAINNNTITLNGVASPFAWDGGFRSQSYWTGTAGFDTGSTITP